MRRSSPEQLGGALVRAGISSCNDNTARDRSGGPTAHRAEPGQRCQARPPRARRPRQVPERPRSCPRPGRTAPRGAGIARACPETGAAAAQPPRYSAGSAPPAAAAPRSARRRWGPSRPGPGAAHLRPPARQEHRAAAAPPRTRARSGGRAERRRLSCLCCDPPPAAAPPPPPPPDGSVTALVGDNLAMSRQVWPCGQEGQWYPEVHREECGQQVVFPLYWALVRPHLGC